jgi:SAM-dependent methyltransferase
MTVTHEESQAYYEDFSLAAGRRDWLKPNARHIQLKLLIRRLVDGRRDLRIADVGCGAGVMTDFLTRYGDVYGVDFSTAAIRFARSCGSTASFAEGGLEALPAGQFDLIALFDVLEHIPLDDRPGFTRDLADRLAPEGLLFCSTPFPSSTRRRKEIGDPTLQIIDEEVELPAVIVEAAAAGLQLLRFETYDVFAGSPEYQAIVLGHERTPGGVAALNARDARVLTRLVRRREAVWARRLWLAGRALSRGQVKTAGWFLVGRIPVVHS